MCRKGDGARVWTSQRRQAPGRFSCASDPSSRLDLQESVHLSKCGTQLVVAALVQSMKPRILGLFLRAALDDKNGDDAEMEKRTGSGCWCCEQLLAVSTKAQVEEDGRGKEVSDWQKKCEFTD